MSPYKLTPSGVETRLFDLRHTLESAQPLTFFADYHERKETLSYVAGKRIIDTRFSGTVARGRFTIKGGGIAAKKRDIVRRFRLADDMEKIYSRIQTDKFMADAVRNYRGMRLTINDPWETTLCYIVSQYNNVKKIRGTVLKIINRFGTEISEGGRSARSFPTSEELLAATEKDFRECGAGFRAKYLKSAADFCTNNMNLYKLQDRGYDEIKESLMEIDGVGDKVADCIALLGYGKLEAFPIDVWVKRTLERVYFKGRDKKIKYLHKFAEHRWGNDMGYAQQYLFWQGRQMEKKDVRL
ncbi:MAG: hypothetical protein KGH58_00795 [Candidatus Micrarchaeota archaeon]|nr:hypothetical protein [Candidatus Micrarchaeota archaeon]